jgi:hypothetical protein
MAEGKMGRREDKLQTPGKETIKIPPNISHDASAQSI